LVKANVSDKQAVSNFSPEDGDSTLVRNAGSYQPIHTATSPEEYHQDLDNTFRGTIRRPNKQLT
jgi:hypothetical protein